MEIKEVTRVTIETPMVEIRNLAREYGVRFVGIKKAIVVQKINEGMIELNTEVETTAETMTEELTETLTEVTEELTETLTEVTEELTETLTEPLTVTEELAETLTEVTGVKISKHFNHPNCQELLYLLGTINVDSAMVMRGTKMHYLITEKERLLLETFKSTGYSIQPTGKVLGYSHTNVWQRLYGTPQKKEKPAKGILGKLREYHQARLVTQPQEVEVTEDMGNVVA